MVNNEEFANRLKRVMDHYGLTATALADSLQIQRSSISHLLSGRNKPSLDFVLRVLQQYPEVELYWLMNGKGTFPSQPVPISQKEHAKSETQAPPLQNHDLDIEKIVVFYTNGTFKSYTP